MFMCMASSNVNNSWASFLEIGPSVAITDYLLVQNVIKEMGPEQIKTTRATPALCNRIATSSHEPLPSHAPSNTTNTCNLLITGTACARYHVHVSCSTSLSICRERVRPTSQALAQPSIINNKTCMQHTYQHVQQPRCGRGHVQRVYDRRLTLATRFAGRCNMRAK
jgi:hypothetical protein